MKKYKSTTMFIEVLILFLIVICFMVLLNPSRVKLYNKSYSKDLTYLDLSKENVNNFDKYIDNLSNFHNLKEIDFGNQIITHEQKDKYTSKYPKVYFNVISTVNIYGLDLKDNITSLDLSNVKIDEKLDDYLAMLKNLKELDIGTNELAQEEQLKLIKKYPNIKFKWNVKVLDEEYSSLIENINLTDKKINDLDSFINSLSLLPDLKTLDMSNTNLKNEELGHLRELFPNVKIDWVLHMGKWSFRTDVKAFSVLIRRFDYVKLTNEDIEVFKYCPYIEALDLGHQKITNIENLISYVPNLRILILADNKISDIKPIAKLKKLQYIELFMNKINDVSPLNECKELLDVNVSYNNVKNMDSILNLPKLERLWIVNSRTSQETLKLLKETYPNVTISTTGVGSTDSGWRTHERYKAMIDMYKKNYVSDVFTKYDNA